jgi:hypothetical protein
MVVSMYVPSGGGGVVSAGLSVLKLNITHTHTHARTHTSTCVYIRFLNPQKHCKTRGYETSQNTIDSTVVALTHFKPFI